MANPLPWNICAAELERQIRTAEIELAIRRQTLNLPNPHTDLVNADKDEEDEEDEEDDDDQSSQEAQVSRSSEPDLERQVEDLNARLDLLRSVDERKRGLLRRIQERTAAAIRLRQNHISTALALASIAPLEADVSRLNDEIEQAECEFGVMDVARQEAYEALDVEHALVVSEVAKLRPLEEQVSTLEAQLEQNNCEFGAMDVEQQEAFEALDIQHTSVAADLGRIPLLERRVSELSADLELAQLETAKVGPLEQQVSDLTAKLRKTGEELEKKLSLGKEAARLTGQLEQANLTIIMEQAARQQATDEHKKATDEHKKAILEITNASLALSIRKHNEQTAADREAKTKLEDVIKDKDAVATRLRFMYGKLLSFCNRSLQVPPEDLEGAMGTIEEDMELPDSNSSHIEGLERVFLVSQDFSNYARSVALELARMVTDLSMRIKTTSQAPACDCETTIEALRTANKRNEDDIDRLTETLTNAIQYIKDQQATIDKAHGAMLEYIQRATGDPCDDLVQRLAASRDRPSA